MDEVFYKIKYKVWDGDEPIQKISLHYHFSEKNITRVKQHLFSVCVILLGVISDHISHVREISHCQKPEKSLSMNQAANPFPQQRRTAQGPSVAADKTAAKLMPLW